MDNVNHAVKATTNRVEEAGHKVQGDAAMSRANDPNRGVVERVEAGFKGVSEKTKESVSGMKADHHAEQAKHI